VSTLRQLRPRPPPAPGHHADLGRVAASVHSTAVIGREAEFPTPNVGWPGSILAHGLSTEPATRVLRYRPAASALST
jgi:hypothetical protein